MNEGIILISTHDLQTAGDLRSAFREEGYGVELVTPGEDVSGFDEAVLLVLTGGLDGDTAAEMSSTARDDLHIPVYGVAEKKEEGWRRLVHELDLTEIFFAPVDPDEVLLLGRTLIERRRLREVTGIVGETEVMQEVMERVVQIAPVKSTVLVTGESGTGKELVARGIHALSPRRHKSFIAVNVAALSETLLESELFGHEKGAFTGAVDTRKGFFELAGGGTIFLDEIGEMPLATQTKLLRVLEQKEFLRVGGEKPIRVDVRIVTATNQDLKQLVAIGEFRRDLYYRLNVLSIELPPLRERREDIPLLVDAFIEEISRSHDREFAGISDEAMEILKQHHWPGNVRELRNLVESMVVLSPGRKIEPGDIPDEIRHPEKGPSLLPATVQGTRLLPERRRGREEGEGKEGGQRGPGGPPRVRPDRGEEERGARDSGRDYRPELEFIFRTLMELRMDVTDLQREFEAYKAEVPPLGRAMREISAPEGDEYDVRVVRQPGEGDEYEVRPSRTRGQPGEDGEVGPSGPGGRGGMGPAPGGEGDRDAGEAAPESADAGARVGPTGEDEGSVVYRPGMTMEDVEREAILAALEEVDGNRRQAAELLEIGERTLYRKIRKYDLDV